MEKTLKARGTYIDHPECNEALQLLRDVGFILQLTSVSYEPGEALDDCDYPRLMLTIGDQTIRCEGLDGVKESLKILRT